ncbi:hypothetical protein [Actinoplanes awajinensis]|uniref:Uncharacterized protein n=1 Tax=Actinoplanes awajinensis subsp. mycoplanecinus TaxID=135947 RepID=A0A101JB16_9ACTN|nr:hypothetical protein [Actinoplanes awajinensis]KUL23490.1 hypothetical protein ADL15_45790 [Actinoplanes awajinensis subsp. mycoplanecinus]
MTTTTTRPAKQTEPAAPAAKRRELRREIGVLAVNAYERGIADIVALEKDAAKITPYPWAKNALTVSAGLIEDVGAAYVRTARQILR